MQFGVLGQLEVVAGEQRLLLGGPKQRALVAILLLHANRPVSRDRLIEGIWGERPPAEPQQALDSYVSRARKLLGADRIVRRADGYMLLVEPGELDLDRFDEAVAAGRFAEALELWRGPALADLRRAPFAAVEAEQLEARRLQALEERIEVELAAGGGAELVTELETLVSANPHRERMVGQLMLALYRSGRQAAALEAFRRARRALAEEVGIDPGPELRRLELRILEQDPALGPPRAARPARTGPDPRNRRRRAAALLAAAGVAAAVVLATRASDEAVPAARTSRIVEVGGASPAVDVPATPVALVGGAGSLWLADTVDQAVLRATPATGSVVDRIPIAGQPGSLAFGAGAVWVASTLTGTIQRIDPGTETVTQTIRLGHAYTSALVYAGGSLWAADTTDQAIVQLDPTSGSARRTISLDVRPTSLVVGEGAIWVADSDGSTVEEIDRVSGQTVATIHVGDGPSSLALGVGGLWVANSLDATVTRIDPATSRVVATIPVGSWPSAVAVARGQVWVANEHAATVERIDPRRNAVVARTRVGGQPVALSAAGGQVWTSVAPAADLHRGGTLVLAGSGGPTSVDPAEYSMAAPTTFTGLVWDSLVRFAAASGPAGLRLVPDLALNVPTPTASGLVYRFRLRPGIHYSDGRPLRARDFRRALERLYRVGSPGRNDFAGVVGAAECSTQRCDLSRGVITDDRSGIVVIRLTRPDADFLYKLTDFAYSAPIPAGVPDRDMGYTPIVGTGPYRIASAGPAKIRFVRNERFREWSHAAQPAGNPDEIDWRITGAHAETIRRVRDGRADWSMDLLSASDLRDLRRQSPSQLHINPLYAVDFLPLNTHAPPFDDVGVRRALNYAIDRRAISRMYGGPSIAAPICQTLVPSLIGYRPYCPYTAHPTAGGAYHGPDIARARALVAASGTRGAHIDLWGENDEALGPLRLTAYVASVLRRLGYRTTLHVTPSARITEQARRGFQLSTDGDWLPSYPAPSSYLIPFFSCGGGLSNGYTCSHHLDAEMTDALSLQVSDPAQAAIHWRRIDREITDLAYWVPTVAPRIVELVSQRVRNYQFQPAYGSFLADQVRLR